MRHVTIDLFFGLGCIVAALIDSSSAGSLLRADWWTGLSSW